MVKVLQIRSSSEFLGAEKVVIELTAVLHDFGIESIIAVPVEKGQPVPQLVTEAKQRGFCVEMIPINSAFDLSAIKVIRNLIEKHQIDLVHSHGYREDLYALFGSNAAAMIATNHLWKKRNWKLKIYAWLDAWLLRFFDAVVAVSLPVKTDMVQAGIREQKISIISNGIDISCYRDIDVSDVHFPAAAHKRLCLCTVSSLTVEKGLLFLLQAFKQLRNKYTDIHLLIVGDGPEREGLEAYVAQNDLQEYVSFLGRREDVAKILSNIDVYVLPSLKEGLPMSLLEAMASSKAVVATDVGDVSAVVNRDTGVLIQPESVEALVCGLEQILSDRAKIYGYGAAAAKLIENEYSSHTMARKYAQLYRETLSER